MGPNVSSRSRLVERKGESWGAYVTSETERDDEEAFVEEDVGETRDRVDDDDAFELLRALIPKLGPRGDNRG